MHSVSSKQCKSNRCVGSEHSKVPVPINENHTPGPDVLASEVNAHSPTKVDCSVVAYRKLAVADSPISTGIAVLHLSFNTAAICLMR